MAVLYDEQGKPVDIPDNQVIEALRSGKYGLPEGQRVLPMMSPDGGVFELPINEAVGASGEGWTFEGSGQRQEREMQEEYGGTGGQVAAGLAGAARGLTFSASDWALIKSGAVDAKTLRALKEVNPAISMGGELATIVASVLTPGGVAGLAGRLGAAPKAAARLGLGAERAAAKALAPLAEGGIFGRMAAKAASVGAGSSIEGGIYGGSQFLSEAALGNLELTAENLMREVGTGALWGGGVGAGLGAGFSMLSTIGKGVGKITRAQAEGLKNLFEKQTGQTALPGFTDAVFKAWGKGANLLKKEGDDLSVLATPGGARIATQNLDEVADTLGREIADLETPIIKATDEVTEYWKKLKPGEIKELIAKADNQIPKGLEDTLLSESDNVLGSIQSNLQEMIAEGKAAYSGKAQLDDILKRLRKQSGYIDRAASKGEHLTGQIHTSLDIVKRDIGNFTSRMGRLAKDPAGEATFNRLADVYEDIRGFLERKDLFGDAAIAQTGVNEKFSKMLKSKDYRVKNRLHVVTESERFRRKHTADPGGAKGLLKNIGKAENINDMAHWREYFNNRLDLVEEHAKAFKWTDKTHPRQMANVKLVRENTKKINAILERANKEIGLVNQLDSLKKRTAASGFGAEIGGLGGFVVGGPPGAAIGYALGSITNPERLLRQLSTIERLASRNKATVERSVTKYINSVKKPSKTKRLIAPASVGILEKTTGTQGRYEAYKKTLDEISRASSDPQGTADTIEQSVEPIQRVAPRLARAIQTKTMKIHSFLQHKIPKDPGRQNVFGSKWRPSKAALSKFERTFVASTNSDTVMEDLANGIAPSTEAVEALQTLYPEKYKQLIFHLTENMDKLQELTYQKRIQLSILFDVPLDPTMEPAFVAAMQKAQVVADPSGVLAPSRGITKKGRTQAAASNLSASQRLSQKG